MDIEEETTPSKNSKITKKITEETKIHLIKINKNPENVDEYFDDIVNEIALKFKEADALIVGTPVYYAGTNGTVVSFLDRLFYSSNFDKTMKVGAAIAIARRGGCTTALDEINRYFSISGMPICASQYWNMVYGQKVGQAVLDEEGMQTMRTLANNMVFMLRSIALGKEKYGLPNKEKKIMTNFIR